MNRKNGITLMAGVVYPDIFTWSRWIWNNNNSNNNNNNRTSDNKNSSSCTLELFYTLDVISQKLCVTSKSTFDRTSTWNLSVFLFWEYHSLFPDFLSTSNLWVEVTPSQPPFPHWDLRSCLHVSGQNQPHS